MPALLHRREIEAVVDELADDAFVRGQSRREPAIAKYIEMAVERVVKTGRVSVVVKQQSGGGGGCFLFGIEDKRHRSASVEVCFLAAKAIDEDEEVTAEPLVEPINGGVDAVCGAGFEGDGRAQESCCVKIDGIAKDKADRLAGGRV